MRHYIAERIGPEVILHPAVTVGQTTIRLDADEPDEASWLQAEAVAAEMESGKPRAYLSRIGRKGGLAKSAAKTSAARANARLPRRSRKSDG